MAGRKIRPQHTHETFPSSPLLRRRPLPPPPAESVPRPLSSLIPHIHTRPAHREESSFFSPRHGRDSSPHSIKIERPVKIAPSPGEGTSKDRDD